MPESKKVDQKIDESEESWTYHLQTSKGIYPISVLKQAETKKEKTARSKQIKEEAKWIEEEGLIPRPFESENLLVLKDNCSYFDACVKQIAKDVIGQGYRIVLKEDKKESKDELARIENFIETSGGERDETFIDTLERGLQDWGFIGGWAWEVSRDDDGQVDGLWHVPAQTLWIHKSYQKYAQVINDKKVWFKKFGVEENISAKTGKPLPEPEPDDEKDKEDAKKADEKIDEKANELIYYRNYYTQSDYYGAPNILSGVGAVMGLIAVRDYNLVFFENYGIPAALIVLKGRWSKATAKQISDFLDVEIKGTDNAHKSFIIHPHKDGEIEYIKLGVEVKEGSFKLYQKSLRDEVLVNYKMPPYRIGIAEVGSLGGNTASESTKIYAASVITPLEKVVERLVTSDLFENGLKVENYRFELIELDLRDLDALVKRWQALFGMGAMNSNQIIEKLGMGGKTYPEGNKYYVSSTYIEVGEELVEKGVALLEAVKLVLKGKPKLAAQVLKIAKKEAKH